MRELTKTAEATPIVFTLKKNICLSAHATFWLAWVKLLMVVRDVPKFDRKNAYGLSRNEQFHIFSKFVKNIADIEAVEAETWHTLRFLHAETENINENDGPTSLLLKIYNEPGGASRRRAPSQPSPPLSLE